MDGRNRPYTAQDMPISVNSFPIDSRNISGLNEKSGSLTKFEKALKPLALVQVSSAFVELVFSQLAFCLHSTGDRRRCLMRHMMELHTLIRVNNGLMDNYGAGE